MITFKFIIKLSLFLSLASSLNAQLIDLSQHADCTNPLVIKAIGTLGPTAAPIGAGQDLEFSNNKLGDRKFIEQEHNTVWYKFKALTTANFIFQLEPLDRLDDYDFALYEYTDEHFCAAVKNKTLSPLRTNFSRKNNELNAWTGLSFDAKNDFEPAGITPAYSKALLIQKGKTYVLLVDNVYDNGKGHLLHFNYTKDIQLNGLIRDKKSQELLPASFTFWKGGQDKILHQTEADSNGAFQIDFSSPLKKKTSFFLKIKHPNYNEYTRELNLNTILSLKNTPILCELERIKSPIPTTRPQPPIVLQEKKQQTIQIKGKLIDEQTNQPLQGEVIVSNIQTGEVLAQVSTSLETGAYELEVAKNSKTELYITVAKEGYFYKDSILSSLEQDSLVSIQFTPSINKLQKRATFVINNIVFKMNSSRPLKRSYPMIQSVLNLMQKNPNLKIKIKGYTNSCNAGRKRAVRLSQRRCDNIRKHLIKGGIATDRIKTKGRGCQKMLYEFSDPNSYLNRRVEIDIITF